MVKRIKLQAGDVFLIPVTKDDFVKAKILFVALSKFKGMIMFGAATDRTFKAGESPEPVLQQWHHVKFGTRDALDKGEWSHLGHDPNPIPPEVTMRRVDGGVYVGEELLREQTEADIKRVPAQSLESRIATEASIRDAMGIPQPPKPAAKPGPKLPEPRDSMLSALSEDRFWGMIEDAWLAAAPKLVKKRPGIATKAPEKDFEALNKALSGVVLALEKALTGLSRDELIAFDRILERKLHDLDRREVQEHTNGSDDAFLYARGFIVGMGRPYYEAVDKDPSKALTDMEEERICYLPQEVFEEKFTESMPESGISRASGRNKAGWP